MGQDYQYTVAKGNVGREPALAKTTNGTSAVNFPLAVNKAWRDKDGNEKEHCEWFNCVAYGPLADMIAANVQKGRELFVTGELRTRDFIPAGKSERVYRTELLLDQVRFCGRRERREDEYDEEDMP